MSASPTWKQLTAALAGRYGLAVVSAKEQLAGQVQDESYWKDVYNLAVNRTDWSWS